MTDFSTIKNLFHITEPNGFSNDEIQIVKNNFGNLPQVFVDYYTELGKIQKLNNTQDSLVVVDRLINYATDEYLIFYTENQHACVWGIHKDDLSKDNPPVYMSFDEKEWNLETETLTDFFTAMAYLQAGFGLDFYSECFYEMDDKALKFIDENFKNKDVAFKQWADGINFYGNHEDDVIIVMSNNQIFYSSNTEKHFLEMDKVLSKLGVQL
ncbi:hypothetical protein [Flavobacterium johnsoniae]|uniref:SMI1/KNR4 family protein n=1 Tax=Flavobacterium johnsoniae (strain ATCC 17061 / DSM 2064 / JCM 8514 / BCRC 14874 / CCUG 350202 / NBRC 14942 / NCIMB 11054 / UW101) TaxID=376686 RepID=A5FJR1_FLAJ1|nr:hypothetical protein [Flavobacterium johnsoniae]ABQ04559.1 hypothetical protein Fjoh_1527 [Flavobacterium johnsoniae UW101]OXE97883.1 hypothetical protein B0A63_17285 [Flavobacterium johnsoniae UW101]WQG83644.1 hypothetical protein SR927_11100 [Flavobacterium johnsoniae UW101]SHK26062.1 hypothetical protein SAMN05444146_0961 [Flavobacterium johnsoniae]